MKRTTMKRMNHTDKIKKLVHEVGIGNYRQIKAKPGQTICNAMKWEIRDRVCTIIPALSWINPNKLLNEQFIEIISTFIDTNKDPIERYKWLHNHYLKKDDMDNQIVEHIVPNEIYQGNCLDLLAKMESESVDGIVTDPPYFLDKMDGEWSRKEVHSTKYQEKSTITSLPAGMKFDKKQGKAFYDFYMKVCPELLRVLKPGGYLFSFGPPRLYHNMACAVEDSGFLIKDLWEWLYTQNQPKAMGMEHFINMMKDVSEEEKVRMKKELSGLKTPQVRSNHEPIVMAQKPPIATLARNHLKHGVGLIDTRIKVGNNKFVSNVISTENISDEIDGHFLVSKPTKKEKGEFNDHKTVKPLSLCRHLISLISSPNSIILDPFLGSGTTAVAAKQLGRKYIGFDLDPNNIEISRRRLENPPAID